jgi:hypothetical protein
MSEADMSTLGLTIQLFLVDGAPNGLVIASINGWTGKILVSSESTFEKLLQRTEVKRPGVYILKGPDPNDELQDRAYIGQSENVRERMIQSSKQNEYWQEAIAVVTADNSLTKSHVLYLESRLIWMARQANRVSLANEQKPDSELHFLPESERHNMEAFIANLRVILPTIGFDIFKPRPQALLSNKESIYSKGPKFNIKHKGIIEATAIEEDGEFVVLQGSHALKDMGYKSNAYYSLKEILIEREILILSKDGQYFEFVRSHSFKSPSAAASVILDRTANGRTEWKISGRKETYEDWHRAKALLEKSSA